jgi:hypothetical protein
MVGRSDVGWVPEFGGPNGRSEVGRRIDLPGSRRADGVSERGAGRLHSGLGHPTAVSGIRFRARIRRPTSDLGRIRPIRFRRGRMSDGCRNSEARTGGRKSEDGLTCPEVGGQMACRRGVPDASTPASDIRPPFPASDFGHASGVRHPTSEESDQSDSAEGGCRWMPEFGGANGRSEVGGRIELPGSRRADGVSERGTGRLYSGLGHPTAGSGLRFRARIRCPVSDVRLRKSPTHPTPRGEKAKNPDQPSCRGSKTATRAVIGTLRPTERRRACLVYTGRCRVFHRHASAGFVTNRFPFRNPEA